MNDVYLSIGSNIGNRQYNISKSISLLDKNELTVLEKSSIYVTEPKGYKNQNNFYNIVMDITSKIENILHKYINIFEINLIDESYKHKNHKKDTSGGHFRLLVVSDDFKNYSLVGRHRLIYQALSPMIKTEIHALSIQALSIEEYNK